MNHVLQRFPSPVNEVASYKSGLIMDLQNLLFLFFEVQLVAIGTSEWRKLIKAICAVVPPIISYAARLII